MKIDRIAVSAALAASLAGCVAMAKKEASMELAAECEAMGENMRVAAREPTSQGGMFGTVTAVGQCLAPGDPGYEDAVPVEEYRAGLERRKG